MEILSLTIGMIFLWHLLVYRFLPFLSGMLDTEDGGSFHLVLITLLPIALVVYKIFDKYGKVDATIGLVISFIIVFVSVNFIKKVFHEIVLHPLVNGLYNVGYTVILIAFFNDLLSNS